MTSSSIEPTAFDTISDLFLDEDNELMERYTSALEAMQGLKGMYKDIVVDRLVNNMKYDQIADKYGISLQTVKNRIRRGKALIVETVTSA